MQEASKVPLAMAHLPILKELEKVPKQWLVNTIYSIIGDDFAEWVSIRIKERN
jgi:hypothetical protein